jgi:hypothetical protein
MLKAPMLTVVRTMCAANEVCCYATPSRHAALDCCVVSFHAERTPGAYLKSGQIMHLKLKLPKTTHGCMLSIAEFQVPNAS